jgi:hypothetical protein
MKLNFLSTSLLLCAVLSASCSKDEGEGGTSTIKGKLMVKQYDNGYRTLLSESAAADENVFIIYGTDHETYDEDYKTSYNGEYEFKYLQKGSYKVFAYTTDTTGVSVTGYVDENKPKIPMFASVDITKNGSTVTVPDFTILKNNDKGSSTIRGKVFLKLYNNAVNFLYNSYYVPDEDVFIIAGNGTASYFDDYKTSYNGEYEFTELPQGNYRIFSYSVDTTGVALNGSIDEHLPKIPVFIDVNVPGNNTEVSAPDISVIKIGS